MTSEMFGGDSAGVDAESSFVPIPVHRPRQEVEQQIRRAIASGQLAEGEKLPSEAVLSEMFNVSRATVREALRSLDTSGLIKKVPGAGGGSFVRAMGSPELAERFADSMGVMLDVGAANVGEVATIRSILEVPAARLAALHRSDADLAHLRDVVDAERRMTVSEPQVPDLDREFHTGIARASRNVILTALVASLHAVMQPVAHIALSDEVGRQTVKQHRRIVDAIEAGDPDGAELAIRAHLDYLAGLAIT